MEKLSITAEEVLGLAAQIARSRIDRVVDVKPGSVTPKDFSQLSDDVLATVAEVWQTVNGAGGSIHVRLYDKMSALEKLGRHFRLWGDKIEPSSPFDGALAAMTEEQAGERAEALRAARLASKAKKLDN
jgi:phage terminase small subunit